MRLLRISILVLILAVVSTPPRSVAAQGTEPASVVTAFDTELNAGNVEAMLALFADDAVVKTQTATYTGKQQLRTLFQELLAEHFQFQSSNRQVTGDTETHTAQVSTDDWRRLSIAPLEARAEVVLRGGRITSFTVAYTPESLAKLQAAQARSAPAQLPRVLPQTGTPLAPLVVMPVGMAALVLGLALRRRSGWV